MDPDEDAFLTDGDDGDAATRRVARTLEDAVARTLGDLEVEETARKSLRPGVNADLPTDDVERLTPRGR